MQRINVRDPRRWKAMPMDEALTLEGQGRRPVRLEVHAIGRAKFEAVYPDETVGFLGVVEGLGVIDFIAVGPIEVWCTPAFEDEIVQVYFYTDEGRKLAFVNDGKVSFTVPHMRQSENERIIAMQSLMLANSERNEKRLEVYRARYLELKRGREEASRAAGEGAIPPDEGTPPVEPPADAGAEGVARDDSGS